MGQTGVEVSALGLGGEGVLRTYGKEREAKELIRRALDLGVTYFESARAYAGSEEYLGRALGPDRGRVFLATKSHNRRAETARAHLDESLTLLRTDRVDLWMVHDVRTQGDLQTISGPGGALETFAKAKERGEVRFIGVSGHENPDILLEALELFPFDCVLLPVNPGEAASDPFATRVIPVARARGMGVIAMKTLCRGLVTRVPQYPGVAPFLRYALYTEGVSLVSVGCDGASQLEENAAALTLGIPPSLEERQELERIVRPHAARLLYYRS